jgi:hypothetical protein
MITAGVAVAAAIVLLTLPVVLRRVRGEQGRIGPAEPAGENDTISLPASLPGPDAPARETAAGANLR